MLGSEDIAMDSNLNSQANDAPAPSPRLGDWLWRPWRAKLWWAAIVTYWAGAALSLWVQPLQSFYETALAGFLNVLFFPFTALLVLGVGFVRARLDSGDWELTEPTEEQMFPKLSVGGFRDPYSDPLDPRSGSLWIGSPQNQAHLFHRKWP